MDITISRFTRKMAAEYVGRRAGRVVMRKLNTICRSEGSAVSISAVLATDKPVRRNDAGREHYELLKLDGMVGRFNHNSIPLLKPGSPSTTVTSIVGSIRSITKDWTKLVGVLVFASDPEAQEIRRQVIAGELAGVELVSQSLEQYEVSPGQPIPGFPEMRGPAVVVTAWQPLYAVLTAAPGKGALTVTPKSKSSIEAGY